MSSLSSQQSASPSPSLRLGGPAARGSSTTLEQQSPLKHQITCLHPPTPPPPWSLATYLESSASVGMHEWVACMRTRTHGGYVGSQATEENRYGTCRRIIIFPLFSPETDSKSINISSCIYFSQIFHSTMEVGLGVFCSKHFAEREA